MNRNGDEMEGEPSWVNGAMFFRVFGSGPDSGRLIKVRRSFAMLGRSDDVDITIEDRSVSVRHTYLHLHEKGVYVVDLLTRTGTRINGTEAMVGWLRPGDSIEVANHRVELVRATVEGSDLAPGFIDHDMLSTNEPNTLARLTLSPLHSGEPPWELGSEMVFLGNSPSCGIQVKDSLLARAHCALVRARAGAFLVDLCGENTRINGRQVRGATRLHDSDRLTLGATDFIARVRSVAIPTHDRNLPVVVESAPVALNPDLVPPETQTALLAWMMGTIQGGQGEVLRRQDAFQVEVTQTLRQIQQDNAALLNAHLGRIEKIDRELGALRHELERRTNGEPSSGMMLPVLPDVAPLNIARPAPRDAEPLGTPTSTTWLLKRVTQLEAENRSAWKDLVSRLGPSRKES